MPRFMTGTSGWVYDHWRGRFYPKELPREEWLAFYCRSFTTAELNYSFYHLPDPDHFRKWGEQVPGGFVFAVKASRYLTHMKKLVDPEEPWERLISGALELGGHLGPVLLQLPPNWGKNTERLQQFLEMTAGSRSASEAVRLAVEFRQESWFADDIYRLLEKHGAALCIADSSDFPRHDRFTAPFAYYRYHGRDAKYGSRYTSAALRREAEKIRKALDEGLDVYAYFNNDAEAYAVDNALTLDSLVAA